ncbi:MAG: NTP transferase domain-containing protein [bacterium]|nr:NTP transferase domain-containing protein [bacterium]
MSTPKELDLSLVIMAAGKGKRMGDPNLSKVLTLLDGKPLIHYVLKQATQVQPSVIVVVVGHQHDAVRAFVASECPVATCVMQEEQLGTGHAVQQTQQAVQGRAANVLILSGDVPLLSATTLRSLVDHHVKSEATLTVLTTTLSDPTGYGRIIRDAAGAVLAIVEQKDASEEQTEIGEINSGVYIVRTDALFAALERVRNSNAQREYYLTDIVGILKQEGAKTEAFHTERSEEVHGINTVADLQHASELLKHTHAEEC